MDLRHRPITRGDGVQFPSCKAAAQSVGGNICNLSQALKTGTKYMGFTWQYTQPTTFTPLTDKQADNRLRKLAAKLGVTVKKRGQRYTVTIDNNVHGSATALLHILNQLDDCGSSPRQSRLAGNSEVLTCQTPVQKEGEMIFSNTYNLKKCVNEFIRTYYRRCAGATVSFDFFCRSFFGMYERQAALDGCGMNHSREEVLEIVRDRFPVGQYKSHAYEIGNLSLLDSPAKDRPAFYQKGDYILRKQ
jgi:hypothetical protein